MKLTFVNKKMHALLIFALALQTTAIMPIENPFKNLGTKIKDLGQSTKEKLSDLSNIATPKMIDMLLDQVNNLQGHFKEFGTRIITGNMSNKDKVIVFGTIVSVVTLTALVVGVSLLKIKNEQDKSIETEIKKISEKTSSGIKGIFEKAKTQLQTFKDELVRLKDCLKNGTCTKAQKQFLYGSAITIAALAMLAVGVGVGAFFYKKHKDAKEQEVQQAIKAQQEAEKIALEAQKNAEQEALKAQEKQKDAENKQQEALQAQENAKNKELAALKAQKDAQQATEGDAKKEAEAKAKQAADEAKLAAENAEKAALEARKFLGTSVAQAAAAKAKEKEAEQARLKEQEATKTRQEKVNNLSKTLFAEINTALSAKLEPAKGALQKYFDKNIKPVMDNTFITVSTETKKFLSDAKELEKQFVNASLDMKEKIIASAQTTFNQAKQKTTNFIDSLKSSGKSIVQLAMDQLFGIKINELEPSINEIFSSRDRLFKAIEPLSKVKITGQITTIIEYVNTIADKGAKVTKKWQETLQQLANRTAEKSSWNPLNITRWAETETDMRERQEEQYPLAFDADKIWQAYPTLIESINGLNLSGPGLILASVLNRAVDLLNSIEKLNNAAGVAGKLIISPELTTSITKLSATLKKLAENIKDTLRIKPLLENVPLTTTAALIEAIKGVTFRVGLNLKGKTETIINNINKDNQNITNALNELNNQKNQLLSQLSNASEKIKEKIATQLKENPLKTVLLSPVVLSRTVANQIAEIKSSFNQILTLTGSMVKGIANIITGATDLCNLINTALGNGFINNQIIRGLETINENTRDINTIVSDMKTGISNSFNIVPGS